MYIISSMEKPARSLLHGRLSVQEGVQSVVEIADNRLGSRSFSIKWPGGRKQVDRRLDGGPSERTTPGGNLKGAE